MIDQPPPAYIETVHESASSDYNYVYIADEKPQLLLYYAPACPFCHRVLNYLNSIGKSIPMKNIRSDKNARKHLKELGGKTQVPCLIIDGVPLYESADIIHWLKMHEDRI